MIAPLRRRHLLAFGILAVLLPAVYAAALLARVPPARMTLPAGLTTDDSRVPSTELRRWPVLWSGEPLGARLLAVDGATGATRLLRIDPAGAPNHPDLLVYWSTEPVTALPGLSHAWLLGPVDPTRARTYTLPPEANQAPGHAVLFSLAEQAIVASASLGGSDQHAAGSAR